MVAMSRQVSVSSVLTRYLWLVWLLLAALFSLTASPSAALASPQTGDDCPEDAIVQSLPGYPGASLAAVTPPLG